MCGAFTLIMILSTVISPETTYYPGSMGWVEWIGMGLLSLGAARCIELLERKS